MLAQPRRCPRDRDVQQRVDDVVGSCCDRVETGDLLRTDSGISRRRDCVDSAINVREELLGQPDIRLLPGDHSHQSLFLTGEDIAPDVEVATHLTPSDCEVIESRVLRQLRLGDQPVIGGEETIPDFVRPLDIDLQIGIERVANVRRKLPDIIVIRSIGHVEPRIRTGLVRQLDQVFGSDAVRMKEFCQVAV